MTIQNLRIAAPNHMFFVIYMHNRNCANGVLDS